MGKPMKPPMRKSFREARLDFFRNLPLEWAATRRFVVLGHHLNDVLETQVMRLTRGASSDGLAAPRPVSFHRGDITLLRPLLDWPKEEILVALQRLNVPWREDASNTQGLFFRNRVRNSVIPALEKASPGKPLEGSRLTRKWLEEDADAIAAWVDCLYPDFPTAGTPLDLDRLSGKPKALWRRVLRRWLDLQGLGDTFSADGFEQVLSSLILDGRGSHTRWSAGPARFIEVKGLFLHAVEREAGPVLVEPGGGPGGHAFARVGRAL
jgi:tRNA(Ile)-lysidine synthase